jgi:hypothetical protein
MGPVEKWQLQCWAAVWIMLGRGGGGHMGRLGAGCVWTGGVLDDGERVGDGCGPNQQAMSNFRSR